MVRKIPLLLYVIPSVIPLLLERDIGHGTKDGKVLVADQTTFTPSYDCLRVTPLSGARGQNQLQ